MHLTQRIALAAVLGATLALPVSAAAHTPSPSGAPAVATAGSSLWWWGDRHKNHSHHWWGGCKVKNGGGDAVPELGGKGVGATAIVVLGAAALIFDRRRRFAA